MRTWVRTNRSNTSTDALAALPRQPKATAEGATEDAAEGAASDQSAAGEPPSPPPHVHALRLLPTPKGTPFTLCYALVLVATTLFITFGDPAVVTRWLAGSSTDVENLAHEPLFVLFASALFYKGALLSAFTVGFVLVLTALERRIGGWRTAAVFVAGHIFATLATQLTVATAVALGHLPESSRSRFDYGIDYGVLACTAALAGVLRLAWLRWVLVASVGTLVVSDLVSLTDPVVDWGHLLAFTMGIALWPLLWRYQRRGSATSAPVKATEP